jgi:hypothetical protein
MRILLALLTVITITGCTSKYNAGLEGNPLSTRDADRQYKARLLELNDGQTTRGEILSVMGDPDRVSDDQRVIMYYWTVKDRDFDNTVRSFVIAEFDAKDVMRRHQRYDHEAPFGGPKLPDDAFAEFMGTPR